jgi:hypothetical protein
MWLSVALYSNRGFNTSRAISDLPHFRCRLEGEHLNVQYLEGVSQRIDFVWSSLPSSEQLMLETVEETTHGVVLRVRAKHLPRCPACFKCRVSYHSRYARRVRDLPWQGRQVEIHLQTRRFRCRNKGCARKIFAESVPAVAARKA